MSLYCSPTGNWLKLLKPIAKAWLSLVNTLLFRELGAELYCTRYCIAFCYQFCILLQECHFKWHVWRLESWTGSSCQGQSAWQKGLSRISGKRSFFLLQGFWKQKYRSFCMLSWTCMQTLQNLYFSKFIIASADRAELLVKTGNWNLIQNTPTLVTAVKQARRWI